MNKKILAVTILTVTLFFDLSGSCLAQELSFGLKCGVNVSNLSQDYADYSNDTKVKMGLALGVYANISVSSSIEIQPEILFSQKGWVDFGYDFECNNRINYLELPLSVKVSFGDIIKPYLMAGPYFSSRLGTSYYKEIVNNLPISGNLDDVIKKTDFGFCFGAGVQTPTKFTLEARYSLGLSAIDNGELDLDYMNTNVSILIGFKLF